MTDIIKLVKKCGALELRIGWVLTVEQLEMVESAIRQDQIEKDEKEFTHLLNTMIESTIINFTDSLLAVQQLNGVKWQVEAAAAYRKYFQEKLTKQVQGDV